MAAQTDIVIAGAGMGGLTAATEATERGADVLVLEKGPEPGGSMGLSAGFVWTYETFERARERIPDGDAALQRMVVESIEEGYRWIEDHGVSLADPPFEMGAGTTVEPPVPGVWKKMDPDVFIDATLTTIRECGGEVRTETALSELSLDGAGRVDGVVAAGPDGTTTIPARCVVLATGGFQGNEELLQRYVTPHTDRLWLRANPHSTGDGLLAAMQHGAKTTPGMGTFYGHNLPAPPAEFDASEFVAASQYYGPRGVALDGDGRRFTDESVAAFEYTLAQDTAREADGRAFIVIDRDLYDAENVFRIADRVTDVSDRFGGRVAEAADLTAVGETLTVWGADGDRAVETLESYNEHLAEGRGDELHPDRERFRTPLDTPPYYIVAVQPGITFTMGGLDVTTDMAVRRRSTSDTSMAPYGTETGRPGVIPGLFAAGVDVGNVSNREYMGGLAHALVTGLRAGESTVAYAGENGDA